MEKMTERKCYVTSYHCDECKPYLDTECIWLMAEHEPNGKFVHECKVCKKRHILNQIYPSVQIIKDDTPAILIQ